MNAARALTLFSVLWAAACIAAAAWYALRNPMAARERALEARLGDIQAIDESMLPPDEAPLKAQRDLITQKAALWKALVARTVGPESKPDLLEKLKDVQAGRQQIKSGGTLKIKLRRGPDDRQGRWVTVGDTVNGLSIKEIRPDAVVFSLKQGDKEYTAELPRN